MLVVVVGGAQTPMFPFVPTTQGDDLEYGLESSLSIFLMVSAPSHQSVKDYTWGATRSGFGLSGGENRQTLVAPGAGAVAVGSIRE